IYLSLNIIVEFQFLTFKPLAAALIWFIRMRLQPGVLRVCLRTLRIISRDRKALAPLITDYAILTLARLVGISTLLTWPEEEEAEWGSHSDITPENERETCLDNNERLKDGIHSSSPPSGQFYELRLLFLLTALRPELRIELRQERSVCMLTAALEQCLEVCWGETHEVLTDLTAPPVCKEVTQRALEFLKTLFNITYSVHRQDLDEEAADLYRHLAAVLRHCLLVPCEGEDRKEELQGHTVNVLSALPLQCLDVLTGLDPVLPSSLNSSWHRFNKGHKLKEKLAPVLNLLTESSKAHKETRHYLRQQILPPLRDVEIRPEQGNTLRSKLVRLMTHVDTDIKHCAAELLFVLCKENVSRFVKYTGYGNAAGLDSDSDTEEYRQAKDRINLVTGRVEDEQPDPMEGMTEEEKEAEALRLINMFNKLSRYVNKIIQPMGVTTDGRLAPLCGQTRHSAVEEEEEEEDDSETEQ
uniref:Synembryn n=1 Tax=Cyprinus carpio TaxID=7962 RepID=A0A8C1WIP2_CYPCA